MLRKCSQVHTALDARKFIIPRIAWPWWHPNLSLENLSLVPTGTDRWWGWGRLSAKYRLCRPLLYRRSIWEDPSFYRLPGQNTIAFSPYTANLAPLCNLTRVTGVFLVSNKEICRISGKWGEGGLSQTPFTMLGPARSCLSSFILVGLWKPTSVLGLGPWMYKVTNAMMCCDSRRREKGQNLHFNHLSRGGLSYSDRDYCFSLLNPIHFIELDWKTHAIFKMHIEISEFACTEGWALDL